MRDPAGVDAFERQYMSDGAPVLYRERSKASPLLLAMYGVAAIGTIGNLVVGQFLAAGGVLAFLALLYVITSVLRVTVTQKSVFIRLALWGPTIPLESIESVEAFRYTFWDYGGWGVRIRVGKGTMYNVPGDGGHAVRIVWTDEHGQRRRTAVGTKHAAALAEQIEEARKDRAPKQLVEPGSH